MCHLIEEYKLLDLYFSYLWRTSNRGSGSSFLPTSGGDCKGERANLAIVWKIVVWIIVEEMAVGGIKLWVLVSNTAPCLSSKVLF